MYTYTQICVYINIDTYIHIRYIFITIVTKEERANNYWVGKKHWRRRGGGKYSFYFWSSQKSLKFLNERNKQAKNLSSLFCQFKPNPNFINLLTWHLFWASGISGLACNVTLLWILWELNAKGQSLDCLTLCALAPSFIYSTHVWEGPTTHQTEFQFLGTQQEASQTNLF